MIGYNLNDNFGLKNGGYSNSENTINLSRHRWYYYKEGFSPFLVEKAIEQAGVTKKDTILDPFNGGGTTTLTASTLGLKSVGVEVNPFTAFLASTKLQNVDAEKFIDWQNKIFTEKIPSKKSPLLGYSTFSQKVGLSKWLFNDDVLNTFEATRLFLNRIDDPNLKDIFKLALITSAIENSNARRDGKCFRYKGDWQNLNFDSNSFNNALKANLDIILDDIKKGPISQTATIINGDARKVIQSENFEKFKLCITSPPYLNTFDYTDIYRPELFLGEFVKNSAELYDLRLHTVRSHIQARWEDPIKKDFGTLYEKAVEHTKNNMASLMHKNIPLMIQAYFEDMFNILTALKNQAQKDAQLWFVVSNSAYAGMEIPVDLIIGDIGSRAGWYLKEIGVLRYINKRKTKHSPEILTLRESVIIFSRSKS
jgi:DNA modification methylase